MIEITDDRGNWSDRAFDDEPAPGSVVLVGGVQGNAWQLYASDGMWHRGKYTLDWVQVRRERNVLLIHDAPPRQCRACEIPSAVCFIHTEGASA